MMYMHPADLPKSGTTRCDINHWIDTYLDLQNITTVKKRIENWFKNIIIQHYRKEMLPSIWNLCIVKKSVLYMHQFDLSQSTMNP